jgi:hypothetical protein
MSEEKNGGMERLQLTRLAVNFVAILAVPQHTSANYRKGLVCDRITDEQPFSIVTRFNFVDIENLSLSRRMRPQRLSLENCG